MNNNNIYCFQCQVLFTSERLSFIFIITYVVAIVRKNYFTLFICYSV